MIKQSSAVLAIFLGSTDARMKMRAPRSINLFATGANGDEDLGQDIIMKGDKYHYQQMGQVEISESANAPVNTAPVRARDDEKKEEPKKEEKKDEKKSEKKGEKKDAKGEKKDEKKADAKDEKKDDKKEDAKADAKADAKEDKKDAKDDEKKEEEKEEKKEQKPGEATWEDHNDCKENEWEAADGNCAFEAEAVKIASHDHRRYPGMDSSLVQTAGPQGIAKDDTPQFKTKDPVKVSVDGYPETEKVHTLSPEVHMEVNNQASTYLFPRTAFYVEVDGQNGLWMTEDPKGIESVKGPEAGAPIGSAVHRIAIEGGEPYADMHLADEPKNGVQHQPVLFNDGAKAAAEKSANQGFTAKASSDASTVATGALKDPEGLAAAAKAEEEAAALAVENKAIADAEAKAADAAAKAADAAKAKKDADATPVKPAADTAPVKPAADAAAKAPAADAAAKAPAADAAAPAKKAADAAPAPKAAALAQIRDGPGANQTENSAVSANGLGSYIHGLTNNVDIYAYKHNEEEPERAANHQPMLRDPYGSIENAEAKRKALETPPRNKGLTPDTSVGFKTTASGPLVNKKDIEAAAAQEASPNGTNPEFMQVRSNGDGDAPPKGFSKIGSVKGPAQGAPIGAGVHDMATRGGEPFARNHDEEEPERGVQHQPVLFEEGQRIKDDQAIPKSLNPGVRAAASEGIRTTGTGALTKAAIAAAGAAEAAAAEETAPAVEPKKEDKPKEKAAAPAEEKAAAPAEKEAAAPADKEAAAPAEPAAKAALMQVQRADIGDKKIDEEVWGFVNADKNTLPWQHRRNEEAYPANGWANPPSRFALDQRNKKDISDKNIDEEVWGFVNADKNTLPWQHRRNEEAYPANGYDNPPGRFALDQRNKKDISDKNIDEEVHGFVNADKNTLPWQHRRNEEAYPANGWANPPSRFALDQRNKKDISDKNIDEEVWGFVNADKNTLPWQHRRNEEAYPANGWANPPSRFALDQKKGKDISDKNIDEEVWGFVNADKNTLPWQHRRNEEAYPANGYDNPPGRFALNQNIRSKIDETGVEPNVYDFVNPIVESTNWIRNKKAYPANGGEENGWKNGAPAALVQTEFLGNPEKLSVVDPIAYQTKANSNTIDGGIQVRRTAFYNKKHGVWMGETDRL